MSKTTTPGPRIDLRILPKLPEILVSLLIISGTLALYGCSDENGAGISSQYSIVKGIVTDDSGSYSSSRYPGSGRMAKVGSAVQGATVVAMSASIGTTLETISDTTETDVEGNFSLTCETTGMRNVIIVATKGTTTWEAVVGSTLKLGETEYCQPLTGQSTAEAEVYTMIAGNTGSSPVTFADVVEVVSSRVASAADNSGNGIEQLAASVRAGEDAWTPAFLSSSVGNAQLAWVNAVQLARTTAEESLELSLNTAGENKALADNAFIDYLQAAQDAYVIEGVSRRAVAQIEAICSRAEANALLGADSSLIFAVTRQTDLVTAFMIKDAVDSSMQVLLASPVQLDSANEAGETLMQEIRNSSSPDEIDSSLKVYHDIIIQLAAEEAGRLGASGVVSADSKVNSAGGLRSMLLTTAVLQLSPGELVQVYAAFFQGVETDVQNDVSALPGVQMNSVAGILMLTNMMGSSERAP